ncbi:MAG: flippase-like domain-containing protein [Acidobacteria bacterium]|nr:flippase-like domain-containing protein [Acidobacteriota bacterium]
MRKKVIGVFWVLGIALLAFIIYKIGPKQIWEHINRITLSKFLILFGMRLVYFVLRAINWSFIMNLYEKRIPLFQLIIARIAGDGISYITPSAYLGGEPVRAMMIKSRDDRRSFASVVIDKTIEIVAMIFLTIVGISIAILHIALPRRYKLIFILFAAVILIFAFYLLLQQQRGLFSGILILFDRIKFRPRFIVKNREKILETDRHIIDFYAHHKKVFSLVFLLHSMVSLFWIFEIHLTLLFIEASGVHFVKSFLVATLGSMAILMPSTPASIGTYELTFVTLIVLVGIPAGAGITMTLLRRIVALLWAGIGLLLMLKKLGPGHGKKT